MHERAGRCGPLHRPRQPGAQGKLRRLPGRTEQQQQPHRLDDAAGQVGRLGEDLAVLQPAGVHDEQEHRQQQAGIADAVHHERSRGCLGGSRTVAVEADQQVGADPDPLPAEEHDQVVVGHDQHEHREHEQRNDGEVAGEAFLVVHVVDREVRDQGADAGDDEHHHDAQRIEQQSDVDAELTAGEEAVDGHLVGLRAHQHRGRDAEAGHERGDDGDHRDPRDGDVAEQAIAGQGVQAVRDGSEQRQTADRDSCHLHCVHGRVTARLSPGGTPISAGGRKPSRPR